MRPLLRAAVCLLAAVTVSLVVFLSSGGTDRVRANNPGEPHYPDIQTLEPSDVRFSTTGDGRRLLKFSNSIANLGDGPIEVFPVNNPVDETTDAYQRVYTHDAAMNWSVYSEEKVGTFVFHPQHNHWHFEGFAKYELRSKANDGGIGDEVLAIGDKISFCMLDSGAINQNLEHFVGMRYMFCGADHAMGISVGFYDTYSYFLPGQDLDITNVPPGEYWLVSTADPADHIKETDEKNNSAARLVTITEPTPIPTPSPTPQPVPKGSADCDDDVDPVDSLDVLRHVAGMPTDAKCLDRADVNCDGDLEAVDAQFILRHVASLPVTLPSGCPPIGSKV